MYLYLLVALIIILEGLAQYCLYNAHGKVDVFSFNLLMAIILYTIICLLLVKSYKMDKMNDVYILWNAGGIIFITLLSVILYDRKIEPYEYLATALVLLAIYLLYHYKK